ncbi:MAG TPA: thioesterase family protein [Longimicrobiales bacterium]|nr:thioesterase family protein [Longimicrobiales bacterium]
MTLSAAAGIVRFRVRYAETDQMGVVYHANYLVWCEIGRTELMRELGYAYADIERAGIRLAVAELSIRYARAAHYDDEIRITTRVAAAQSRTITFGYDVARDTAGGAELLATATTTLIAIDERGAPRRLPSDLIERFRAVTAS